ncbi:2-acylglycerol O-acyltransferase 2 isoform X2 [Equus asinus]|uniref:2-acylglycerol O-acyltransferase 2 isoform X2 n=1 Tax=Equus asinus TaxID=9793 RepID=UPI001D05009F|nr:2-acylglycerol O-acyltransferase 2 isoform X1 [Equus asinus]
MFFPENRSLPGVGQGSPGAGLGWAGHPPPTPQMLTQPSAINTNVCLGAQHCSEKSPGLEPGEEAAWWSWHPCPCPGSAGGRPSQSCSGSPSWSWLVKTAELDPSRNYLAGFHPQGIMAPGAFVNLCTESTSFSSLFPGIRPHLIMLPFWFRVPFFREYLMMGGLVTSDKESIAHILNRKGGGNPAAIIIGGAQEALNARPGAYTLLLRNRKGFIKLALLHGAALVPMFSFGENDLFDQVENSPSSWLRWIQDKLQKTTSFSFPLFHGRGIFQYSFGFIPYRQPITTVVGKPIAVQKTLNPSQEEVDQLHQRYIKELCDLFEAHKLKYNVPIDQHLDFC